MTKFASITLSELSWSTPDGEPVLPDLDLVFNPERCGVVGRNGVGKSTLLKLIDGTLEPTGGRILLNGKVQALKQIVQVGPEDRIAGLFGVTEALALLRRAESGDATIDEISEADWTLEARIDSALSSVGLQADADTRLRTLSGGQRTRAALAAALFGEPDFLLLDEPTNNLDREGRDALLSLLGDWRAGAIIVSHDRELLETMDAIVELTSLGATRYGGNWTHYRERKVLELSAAQHDLAVAERQIAEVDRKVQVARERKDRRDATGHRKGARGDMPRILLGGRKERAENSGGAGVRLSDRLRQDARAAAAAAREKIEILEKLAVTMPPTHLAKDRRVLDVEHLSFGYQPGTSLFVNLSFTIVGSERIALLGPNGSGKTSLLRLVAGHEAPGSGRIIRHVPFAMLDQSVAILDPDRSVLDNFRAIHREADDNSCRAALARFQFRADVALRKVGSLSGGQMLRAGLACVLGASPPQLLILDEPTNHLDLESIEAIEQCLIAYDGAMMIVSHDESLLGNIGITRRIQIASPLGAVGYRR